jgi:hypothetical protein
MEPVPEVDFLRWAASVGIGFDPRYPESGLLRILPRRDQARFWVLPPDPAAWPHFIASLLESLDEWDSGLLWPRSGSWPNQEKSPSYDEGVRDVILRGVGVPAGWAGALRFGRDEKNALIAVMYPFVAFGGCGDDDLIFVPDHGRQLLQSDHHDVIHAQCGSSERIQKFVDQMAEAGYDLPTKLPDETFKRPAWMVEPSTPVDRSRD